MRETVTEAFVLGIEPFREGDIMVDLFTKDFGRIRPVVRSGRKLGSKLSTHLDVLNLSRVRIINKNRFLLVDALTLSRFKEIRNNAKVFGSALDCFYVLKKIVPILLPDKDLWYHVLLSFKNLSFSIPSTLAILGYDPKLSECNICGGMPKIFFITDQVFLCSKCSGSVPEKEIIRL